MAVMRESWTDARLDEFRLWVEERFGEVDRRFDEVDRRFDRVDDELGRINDRLDGIQHTMVYGLVAMISAFLAAMFGLIATQL
jgi:hypothetical protein